MSDYMNTNAHLEGLLSMRDAEIAELKEELVLCCEIREGTTMGEQRLVRWVEMQEEIATLKGMVNEIQAARHVQREHNNLLVKNHKLREQVCLYEQALAASWPDGAMGDAFDFWNAARKLAATEPKP